MIVRFTEEEIATMQKALDKWGLNAQCDQTVEECAELIVALHKHLKRLPEDGSLEAVVGEIADVEMMLAQMRLALEIEDDVLRERIKSKFEKLQSYLDETDSL